MVCDGDECYNPYEAHEGIAARRGLLAASEGVTTNVTTENATARCVTVHFTLITYLNETANASVTEELQVTKLLKKYEYIFARSVGSLNMTEEDLEDEGDVNYAIITRSSTTCTPRLTLEALYMPPPAAPPMPPARPPKLAGCRCPSASLPPMTASLLSRFFTELGTLPQTELYDNPPAQCQALLTGNGSCTYQLLSEALRQGWFRSTDITRMVPAPVVCNAVARQVCTCPPCGGAPETGVTFELLRNNSLVMQFTEPVVTQDGDILQLDDISVSIHGWSPALDEHTLSLPSSGAVSGLSLLNVSMAPPAIGGEQLAVRIPGLSIFGARGGALPAINATFVLNDMTPPLFSARLVSESPHADADFFDEPRRTLFIEFNEPCYGSGPQGTVVADDWELTVDFLLARASPVIRRSWQEPILTDARPPASNASMVLPPANPLNGTVGFDAVNMSSRFVNATSNQAGRRRLDGINAGVLGTTSLVMEVLLSNHTVMGQALVFLLGPKPSRITDRANNALLGLVESGLPPLEFAMPLPPPERVPERPAGITQQGPASASAIAIGAVIAFLLLLFLLLYLMYRRRESRRTRAKKKLVAARVESLESVHDVLMGSVVDVQGIDGKTCELLDLAIARAVEQQRPLNLCAQEIFMERDSKTDVAALFDAAHAAFFERSLTPAANDREALESLLMWLNEATTPSLQQGWDGGGGVRVVPQHLKPCNARGHQPPFEEPVVIHESALPVCILDGAANTFRNDIERRSVTVQQQLYQMKHRIEDQCTLPPTIAAALIASLTPALSRVPTECEQIATLSSMINSPTSAHVPVASAGGGVRIRPPRLLAEAPSPIDLEDDALSLRPIEGAPPDMPPILEVSWLKPGTAGFGGVCIAPPRLKPPVRSAVLDGLLDAETDAVMDASSPMVGELHAINAPLEDAPLVSGFDGGFGVRACPPRLLPYAPPVAPSLLDQEEPPLTELEAQPLEAYGGGARLPPPRLLPVAADAGNAFGLDTYSLSSPLVLRQALLDSAVDPQSIDEASYELLGMSVERALEQQRPLHMCALEVFTEQDSLSKLQTAHITILECNVMPESTSWGEASVRSESDATSGAPVVSVSSIPDSLEIAMSSDSLVTGFHGGGGARVFAPRLLPFIRPDAPGLFEELSSPLAELQLATLTVAEGGGARIAPPKLLPAQITLSMATRFDAEDGTAALRQRAAAEVREKQKRASLVVSPRPPGNIEPVMPRGARLQAQGSRRMSDPCACSSQDRLSMDEEAAKPRRRTIAERASFARANQQAGLLEESPLASGWDGGGGARVYQPQLKVVGGGPGLIPICKLVSWKSTSPGARKGRGPIERAASSSSSVEISESADAPDAGRSGHVTRMISRAGSFSSKAGGADLAKAGSFSSKAGGAVLAKAGSLRAKAGAALAAPFQSRAASSNLLASPPPSPPSDAVVANRPAGIPSVPPPRRAPRLPPMKKAPMPQLAMRENGSQHVPLCNEFTQPARSSLPLASLLHGDMLLQRPEAYPSSIEKDPLLMVWLALIAQCRQRSQMSEDPVQDAIALARELKESYDQAAVREAREGSPRSQRGQVWDRLDQVVHAIGSDNELMQGLHGIERRQQQAYVAQRRDETRARHDALVPRCCWLLGDGGGTPVASGDVVKAKAKQLRRTKRYRVAPL